MTKQEALDLYSNLKHEIAGHGFYHYSLGEVSISKAVYDICKDRETLEEMFGKIVNGFAYANGSYNDTAVEALKACGVTYARTTVQTGKFDIPSDFLRMETTCHHNNPKLIEYANNFLSAQDGWNARPLLFYVWGHTYEFDDNDNWNLFEEFAEKVSNNDGVWYATNGEIYDYVIAYNRLIYSMDGNYIKNLSAIDVYLSIRGIKILVKAGETVKSPIKL